MEAEGVTVTHAEILYEALARFEEGWGAAPSDILESP
jgi:hypothetical protein